MTDKPAESWIAIDLLRFACAMVVVCYHVFAANAWQPIHAARVALTGLERPDALTGLFWWGWTGVPIFFAISGYVIAGSALGTSPGPFLLRRAMRLYPATWICASVTALLLVMQGEGGLPLLVVWLYGMTLASESWLLDGSYWTLPLEIIFYLVIATALIQTGPKQAGLTRTAVTQTESARRLEMVGAVLGLIGLIGLFLPATDALPLGRTVGLFVAHAAEFALGMGIAALHRAGATPTRLGLLALWFGVTLTSTMTYAASARIAMHVDATVAWPMAVVAIGIAVLATAPLLQPVLHRHGTARLARTAGLVTFPLYLIHQAAGAIVIGALVHGGMAYTTAAVIVIGLALVFAIFVAQWAEPALRRAVLRRVTPSHAPAPDRFPTASPPAG